MIIRPEYFHFLLLPLFITTTGALYSACEDIVVTGNGSVVYMEANYFAKHAPGTTALMLCKFGYINSFPSLIFCQSNGKWNDKLGECKLIGETCDPQNNEFNVTYIPSEISKRYPSGTFAILQCSVGQMPIGPSSALCLNGKWNAELGYCKELISNGITKSASERHNIVITSLKAESGCYTEPVSTEQSGTTTDTVTVNAKNKSKITNTPPESTKSSKMVPDVIFDGLDTASIVNMESTVLPSLMMEKLIDESTEVTISSVLEND